MTRTDQRASSLWLRRSAAVARAAAPRLWRALTLSWLLGSAITIAELLLVRSVGRHLLAGHALHLLLPALLGLAATLLLGGINEIAMRDGQLVLLDHIDHHLELRLADVAMRASAASLQDPAFHDDLSRIQAGTRERTWQLINAITGVWSGGLMLVSLLAVLVITAPLLLVVAVIGAVPLWFVSRRNSNDRYRFEYAQSAGDRERRSLAALLTGGSAALEVRALGLGAFLLGRLDGLWRARHEARRASVERHLRYSLAATALSSLAVTAGGAVIAVAAADHRIRLADAAVGVLVLRQVAVQLRTLSGSYAQLRESQHFLDDLDGLVDAHPAPEPPGAPVATLAHLGLRGVRFRYPGSTRWAVDGVDLAVAAGEVIALVGPNGSGKSTLAKLLTFLYPPTEGTIEWNGIDTTTLDPAALREAVATVFQESVRYPFTAGETIALGRADEVADAARVRDAAVRAGVDDVLDALPHGFDTRLTKEFDGGVDLSGGQLQRVALARAFYRDAQLLVLDEPTAALDARSEADLFDRLHALAEGRTVIVISHRFATVRRADRIVVLEGGRTVQVGTHDELMAAGGYYASAFAMQAAAYLDGGSGAEGSG